MPFRVRLITVNFCNIFEECFILPICVHVHEIWKLMLYLLLPYFRCDELLIFVFLILVTEVVNTLMTPFS